MALCADQDLEATVQNVNTNSKPSQLKITDLRVANLGSIALVRIDTNQGIYGLGETYTASSKFYPLMLKSRVLGENPCNVDQVFRKIKQFGHHARQASGVSSIEMALWDLAGKAYNVPVFQMLGGKFRDQIRIYCDTPVSADDKLFKERTQRRLEQGYTFFKADVGVGLVQKIPGTVSYPAGANISGNLVHMLTGLELTDKGIALMSDYMARIRETVGWQVPLATDHFGHMGVNSCIRLGKAFEKFNLAWMEDFIPWQYTELLKKITDSIDVPTCTGEDIYLKESFHTLCEQHAVDIIHPDLSCAGGIFEIKKIGDMAQEYGVAMAMHTGATPVGYMACVHAAAATENFLALEHHQVDTAWWEDMAEGVEKPIIRKGFAPVPEKPGLGVTLNEEVVKKHLSEPGYFEPTPQWDRWEPNRNPNDRLWS